MNAITSSLVFLSLPLTPRAYSQCSSHSASCKMEIKLHHFSAQILPVSPHCSKSKVFPTASKISAPCCSVTSLGSFPFSSPALPLLTSLLAVHQMPGYKSRGNVLGFSHAPNWKGAGGDFPTQIPHCQSSCEKSSRWTPTQGWCTSPWPPYTVKVTSNNGRIETQTRGD